MCTGINVHAHTCTPHDYCTPGSEHVLVTEDDGSLLERLTTADLVNAQQEVGKRCCCDDFTGAGSSEVSAPTAES